MCELCENCIHKVVCGEKTNYKNYVNEMEDLNKKYELPIKDFSCPYYSEEEDKIKSKEIAKDQSEKEYTLNDVYKLFKDKEWLSKTVKEFFKSNGKEKLTKDQYNEIVEYLNVMHEYYEYMLHRDNIIERLFTAGIF